MVGLERLWPSPGYGVKFHFQYNRLGCGKIFVFTPFRGLDRRLFHIFYLWLAHDEKETFIVWRKIFCENARFERTFLWRMESKQSAPMELFRENNESMSGYFHAWMASKASPWMCGSRNSIVVSNIFIFVSCSSTAILIAGFSKLP